MGFPKIHDLRHIAQAWDLRACENPLDKVVGPPNFSQEWDTRPINFFITWVMDKITKDMVHGQIPIPTLLLGPMGYVWPP